MAARGTESKEVIIAKLLETFGGAFRYNKEIRIPMIENGEEVQIKITLTAAKQNVEHEPLKFDYLAEGLVSEETIESVKVETPPEPTEEEKENLKKMMASLLL